MPSSLRLRKIELRELVSFIKNRALIPLAWLALLLVLRKWKPLQLWHDHWRRWQARKTRRRIGAPKLQSTRFNSAVDPFVRVPDAGPGCFEELFADLRRITDSSFGSVFECHRRNTDSRESHVVKIVRRREHPLLRVASHSPRRRFAENEEFWEYMSKLKVLQHDNVVRYLEFFADSLSFYFLMEYCPGQTLLEHLLTVNEWQEPAVKRLMEQLLKALRYLHGIDVLHRDVKLENLMVTQAASSHSTLEGKTPILKLLDFGLGCERRFACGTVGTLGYMAPEVFGSKPYTTSVDVFSAGVVFHICLTGRPPFKPPISMRALDDHLQDLMMGPDISRKPLPSVSMHCRELLDWMLLPGQQARCTAAEALRHPGLSKKDSLRQAPVLWGSHASELRFLRVMGVWNGGSTSGGSTAGKDSLQVIDEAASEEEDDGATEQLLMRLVRQMEVPVSLSDPTKMDCPLVQVSYGFEALTGYQQEDVLGRNCRFLNMARRQELGEELRLRLREASAGDRNFTGLVPNVRKDGTFFENMLHLSPINVLGHKLIVGIQMEVDKNADQVDVEIVGVARKVHSALRHWQRSGAVKPLAECPEQVSH
mmetsp:Transcript_84472/g.149484  ORF Transcript_84472/g.149484 Transcript_84472/m.149484 type:complete len:594 (-) Transcript_84472:21-1802(-)